MLKVTMTLYIHIILLSHWDFKPLVDDTWTDAISGRCGMTIPLLLNCL